MAFSLYLLNWDQLEGLLFHSQRGPPRGGPAPALAERPGGLARWGAERKHRCPFFFGSVNIREFLPFETAIFHDVQKEILGFFGGSLNFEFRRSGLGLGLQQRQADHATGSRRLPVRAGRP